MSQIEFFMAMQPPTVTAQMRKVSVVAGKPHFYDSPEVEAAKEKLRCRLAQHRPKRPLDGPLRLYAKWCFPMIGGVYDGQPKHTKPDTDNLQKALKDVMEELKFYPNDSRIAEEFAGKYWAKVPGIWIRLEEIEWKQ